MDDLYDNLENYHDENIIDELKNENKDLKVKLEEYSSAMMRLQNDFDKLNSEYKKLEINYSSLLKTARAEIDRKAEMIKNLNSEKDRLILTTLQSSGKNIMNARSRMYDTQRSSKNHEIYTESTNKPQPEPELGNQNKGKTHRLDRIHSPHTYSEDTSSLENKSNFNEDKGLRDTSNYLTNKTDKVNNTRTKEIHKDVPIIQCHKIKGEKISNRRKSMPMCRIEPIFSSDDDLEALSLKHVRKSPLQEDIRHNEKYSNKDNCYRSIKDRIYSNKTKRFTDHDNYRHDRYESGSRYTRHSPEKYRSKNIKAHSELHKIRGDYKQRSLRSPPIDKYNRSKSRDRRTFDRENYYDKQRYSPHNYDNTAVKHKIRNELEEPSNKRQKTELIKGKMEENIHGNNREKELCLRSSFPNQQDFIEPLSCQSPDYVNIDSTITQHVTKEIKHTAITPLEDPRVGSVKYKENNKEKVLSTVNTEQVYIKPIDVSTWDVPNIKKFLISQKFPIETNKQFMDEIYNMNIENPLLSDSLESGEILSLNDFDKESDVDNIYENINKNKHQSENLHRLAVIDSNERKNPAINKYKITKIKKPDKISAGVKHDGLDRMPKNQIFASEYCNKNKEESEIKKHCIATNLSQPTPNNAGKTTDDYKMIKTNCNAMLSNETLVAVGTLADDLELSDEACESRDLQKAVKKSKKTKDKTSTDNQKNNLPSVKIEKKHGDSKDKSSNVILKKVPKDTSRDSSKNRKTKKQINNKEVSCTEAKEHKEQLTVQKVKDKQSKPVISIQTKNKFSDLFGESSSLITPDDLGIPSPNIQLPLSNKYVPIFDNTQDAVDLSVEDINRAQSNTCKPPDELCNDTTIIEKPDNDGDNTLVSKDVHKSETTNNLYENATTNDASEIVKTVIISTGVQPKHTLDSQKICTEHTDSINNDKVNMTPCILNRVKALATSTPQKPELEDTATLDPKVPNDTCKITENNNLSYSVSNSSNPDKALNEADVPDVRIFVRRRRKIIKKS